jgi:hypothetical protein
MDSFSFLLTVGGLEEFPPNSLAVTVSNFVRMCIFEFRGSVRDTRNLSRSQLDGNGSINRTKRNEAGQGGSNTVERYQLPSSSSRPFSTGHRTLRWSPQIRNNALRNYAFRRIPAMRTRHANLYQHGRRYQQLTTKSQLLSEGFMWNMWKEKS